MYLDAVVRTVETCGKLVDEIFRDISPTLWEAVYLLYLPRNLK